MPFYQPQASISHPVNFYEQPGLLGNRRVLALGAAKSQPPGALDTGRLGQGQLSSPYDLVYLHLSLHEALKLYTSLIPLLS